MQPPYFAMPCSRESVFHRKHWLPFVFSVADGKDTLMQRNKDKKKQAGYNSNRPCFLSDDGKYYCYEVWNPEQKRVVIEKHEIGKDGLTEEWTLFLDSTDHDWDLNDRYQSELKDALFESQVVYRDRGKIDEYTGAEDPWEREDIASPSVEDVLFAEPEEEDPQEAIARSVVEDSFTESQKDFYYAHFGMGMQIEEIRQEEAAKTGKLPTSAAMTNRKNKMLDKVAKALGTTRVKRHKYPGQV